MIDVGARKHAEFRANGGILAGMQYLKFVFYAVSGLLSIPRSEPPQEQAQTRPPSTQGR